MQGGKRMLECRNDLEDVIYTAIMHLICVWKGVRGKHHGRLSTENKIQLSFEFFILYSSWKLDEECVWCVLYTEGLLKLAY